MKFILLICLIIPLNNGFTESFLVKHNPPPPVGPVNVNISYLTTIDQKLDHFNPDDNTTWEQQYYVTTDYYDEDARNVAFLMLGGEAEIAPEWMSNGAWVDSARKYKALMFQLEHRFYGESQPFEELSTENLRYLTSAQALEDIAYFINSMNDIYKLASDVKWIVFGGSYSGALAAWIRDKHPELVHASVAASAPILAQLDFTGYMQVTIDNLAASSQECADTLQIAMQQVEEFLTAPYPEKTVTSIFNLCAQIEGLEVTHINRQQFYNTIAHTFSSVAQTNGFREIVLDDLCAILTYKAAGNEIYRLADVLKLVHGVSCLNYDYITMMNGLRYSNKRLQGDQRQWTFQTCNEFGWFQSSNRDDEMFGKGCPLSYFTSLCYDVFGEDFNETYITAQVEKTNKDYGGLGINASNIVFTHGSVDPWHATGLNKTVHPDSPVIYVEGASHCATMYNNVNESPQLIAAKNEIDRLVGVWLGYE